MPAHVAERIEYELGVIQTMGFSAYFLVVWDLVRYAREAGIRVGPGRGSAAGSCVAYCLHIVDIDPIRYDLLFERFLNPGRKQMPDIDMDFDSRYRGDLIRYAAERYGDDHVAQIITFSTIKARAAVRDAARVLGYPYLVGDKIAKLMPPLIMGRDTPLAACLDPQPKHEDGYKMAAELRELYAADPDAKRVVDVARGLEGLRRQDGIHAAAVVITREPLTEYLPIQRKPQDGGDLASAPVVTQYEMHGVEDLGLLKMDFLGLRNLDVLEITLDLVEAHVGDATRHRQRAARRREDVRDAPAGRHDRRLPAGGRSGALAAAIAGPDHVRGHRGARRALPAGPDGPELAQRVREPQERAEAGHVPTPRPRGDPRAHVRADDLPGAADARRAAARRLHAGGGRQPPEGNREEGSTAHRERTLEVRRGVRRRRATTGRSAQEIFDTIEPFADYSFNKSHSVGYGYLAYQTAYLKANHPVEYLAALLTSVKSNKDQTAVFLNECRQRDIPVMVPDVNESEQDFTVRDTPEGKKAIRYGLSAVRNVGEGVVAHVVRARQEGGPFTDFYDFCDRVDPQALNKRTVESLAKAGAFDSLGHTRKGIVDIHEQTIERALGRRRERDAGIMNLFADRRRRRAPTPSSRSGSRSGPRSTAKAQRLAFEKEMLGLYVSDHPLLGVVHALRRLVDGPLSDLREKQEGDICRVGGIVTGLARKYTRKGDLMATFTLEDLGAAVEVMVFPRVMADHGHALADDAIVCVRGRVDLRDDQAKVVAAEITAPELSIDDGDAPIRIQVRVGALSDAKVVALKDLLLRHPGNCPVFSHLLGPDKTTVIRLGDEFRVEPRNALYAELRELFGPDCLA